MLATLLPVLTAITFAVAQPRPVPEPLFHVGRFPATRAVVHLPGHEATPDAIDSEMTRLLRGIVADLGPREVAQLRACVPGSAPPTASTELASELYILTLSAQGGATKRVRILRAPDGGLIGAEEGADGSPGSGKVSVRLDTEGAMAIIRRWPAYRGGFDQSAAEAPTAAMITLEQPYEAGAFTLDSQTLRRRIEPRGVRYEPATRALERERFLVRLPRGYDPRTPAGLLLFIDPSPVGEPPPPLHHAADEMGFILAGVVNTGNDRAPADRLQLALDLAATVSARYHVDQRRIYATGLSGGGRISTMLWAGFPEVVRGAVPIAGLACYQPIPIGGHAYRADFLRPAGGRWLLVKEHRLAAITGSKDYAQGAILAAAQIMAAEGLSVKVLDFADQGHTYPTAQRFAEALLWVDEPYRKRRTEAEARAAALLEQFEREAAGGRLTDAARRRALVNVTAEGPWTPAAWEACELLGLVPTSAVEQEVAGEGEGAR
jgi:dienelactone hydrolase